MGRLSWLVIVLFAACSGSESGGAGTQVVAGTPRITGISIQGPTVLCGGQVGTYLATMTGDSFDPQAITWEIHSGSGKLSNTMGSAVEYTPPVVPGATAHVTLVAASRQEPELAAQMDVEYGNRWPLHMATPAADWVSSVLVDPDGSIVVAGYHKTYPGTNPAPPDWGGFVLKYDASGVRLWQRFIGAQDQDLLLGAALGPAGEIYAVGTHLTEISGAETGFLVALDRDGNTLWENAIDSAALWADAVAVGPDGGVVVTGITYGTADAPAPGGGDIFVTTFDASGAPGWWTQVGGDGVDDAQALTVDARGEVTVAGSTSGSLATSSSGMDDVLVAHLDATGSVLWLRQFGTAENDLAASVASDPGDGTLYVTGAEHQMTAPPWDGPPGTLHAFLVHLDADGGTLWQVEAGAPAYQAGRAMALRPQGGVYVGSGPDPDGGVLWAWDASGTLLWSASPTEVMVSSAMAVGMDGSIYLGGSDFGADGTADAIVVKLDASGVEQCR